MSRIDELIEQLCPDGVEFFELSEVTIYRKDRILSAELTLDQFVGVDNLLPNKKGKVRSKYGPNTAHVVAYSPGDILVGNIRPYLRKVWLADNAGGASGDVLVFGLRDEFADKVDCRFLYYVLSSEEFFRYNVQSSKGAKMPRGDKKALKKFRIPVPPLEVQREIVRVLDLFTSLEAELEAELEARRLQYEHYRDYQFEMLLADETVQKLPLGDVVERVRTGLNPRANFKLNTEDADKYYVTVRELSGLQVKITEKTDRVNDEAIRIINNRSNLKPGDILFSGTGTIGRTAIVPEGLLDWNIKEGVYALTPDASRVSSLYLTFFLMSQIARKSFERASEGGTVASVSMEKLKKITVPIPPRDVQLRLSSVIELFYRLALGVSDGLPAEITARRQQYEYYRDKLLTFKEKVG